MKTIITLLSIADLMFALGCGEKQAETEKGHEGHDHNGGNHSDHK